MRRLLLAAALAVLLPCLAFAQGYPSKAITMVVPFAAGGPTDTIARIFAVALQQRLGQTVVVENTTGAAGTIGVGRVARAAPDGYTLGIGHWSTHVVNGAIYPLTYDLLNDFEPVSLIASNPQLLVAKKSIPAKDLTELVAWVKANQDKISAGTAGAGAASHVSGVYFQSVTNTRFTFVPYRGTAPALTDIMSGNVQLFIDPAFALLPTARDGTRARALGIASKTRSQLAPDLPTIGEQGLPGFEFNSWYGVWAPKGTPRDITEKVNALMQETLRDPAVVPRLTSQLLEPVTESIAESKKFIAAEIVRARDLLKLVNFQPE